MTELESVLVTRDGMTEDEAAQAVAEAREELLERIEDGDMPFDICEEIFGLEPDYLLDLIY